MGLIREPEGIDFVIKSRPLTKKEQEQLSKFILEEKAKRTKKMLVKKTVSKASKLKKKKVVAK